MHTIVAAIIDTLRSQKLTLATAESLTAGAVCSRLVDIPGASDVVRGGVCAYATDLKASLLGVDARLLAERGPVDAEVARQMARGVRTLLSTDVAVATTGVAGPGPADGFPAGTVHIACVYPEGILHRKLKLEGDREQVRTRTIDAVMHLLAEAFLIDRK